MDWVSEEQKVKCLALVLMLSSMLDVFSYKVRDVINN